MSSVRVQPKLIILSYEDFVFSEETCGLLQKFKAMGHYIVIQTKETGSIIRQAIAGKFLPNEIEFDLIYDWGDFLEDLTQENPDAMIPSSNQALHFCDYAYKSINAAINSENKPSISKESTIFFCSSFEQKNNSLSDTAIHLGYQKENLLGRFDELPNKLRQLLPLEPQPPALPVNINKDWKMVGAIIGCIVGAIVAGIVGPGVGLKAGIQTFIWWASLGAMGTVGGWFVGEELGKDAIDLRPKAELLNDRQAAVVMSASPIGGATVLALNLLSNNQSNTKPTELSPSTEYPKATASSSVAIPQRQKVASIDFSRHSPSNTSSLYARSFAENLYEKQMRERHNKNKAARHTH